jgi:YedE family putative selenium metabolism protein
VGAFRNLFIMKDTHLLGGLAALVIGAFLTKLCFGKVQFGFAGQPIAHADHLWNVLGMVLAGLAYALANGCPGRQLFLAGEGDSDAGVFVLGMFAGAAFAHNFTLAGVPDKMVDGVVRAGGLSGAGQAAVLLGLAVCAAMGFFMREK